MSDSKMKDQDPMDLHGRKALVTSSSRNLGADIARGLAHRGATVAVTYKQSRSEANELVRELREHTAAPHVAVEADLSTADGVRPMVDAATRNLEGAVDILVNNYGPFSIVPFQFLTEEEFKEVWDSNVTVAYLATQAVAPDMRSRGWGRIVNISAGSAYIRNHSVYGLAKAAIINLTESLALELGPQVTVNAIAPGQIEESSAEVHKIDNTFIQRAIERTPAGRLVTRQEVGDLVAMICTDPFEMVTGHVVPVDGGWRLNRF